MNTRVATSKDQPSFKGAPSPSSTPSPTNAFVSESSSTCFALNFIVRHSATGSDMPLCPIRMIGGGRYPTCDCETCTSCWSVQFFLLGCLWDMYRYSLGSNCLIRCTNLKKWHGSKREGLGSFPTGVQFVVFRSKICRLPKHILSSSVDT